MKAWLASLLYAGSAGACLVLGAVLSIALNAWASSIGNDDPQGTRQSLTLFGKACEMQGALPSEEDSTCVVQSTLRLRNGAIEVQIGSRSGRQSLSSMLNTQWRPIAEIAYVAHDFPDMWRTQLYWPAIAGAWLLVALGAWLAFVCIKRAIRWGAVQDAQASRA